jgi:ABC-type uncharacterized transport system ATPase subunit
MKHERASPGSEAEGKKMRGQGFELDSVTKRCGDCTAVCDVSRHGFPGPNGAGKPMPIRMICDATEPTLLRIRRAAA